ncbi:hypothetical protein BKA69DRAFT_1040035 [Paraphysoderma sedebokerense]|nr:hypothetical protein BKA69DRAFT_1040035 [Paraphysoderma sedebokerense]
MKLESLPTFAIFVLGLIASTHARPRPQSPAVPSGRCGKDFGLATCEKFPGELCCSEFGFCGGTADHCKPQSCQFGCDNKNPFLPGTVDPKKSAGSTNTTPPPGSGITPPTYGTPANPPTQATTPVPNGRCGRDFGLATCEKFPGEFCCSQYGYCGGTAEHCNPQTCQFGCDNKNPLAPGKLDPKAGTNPPSTGAPQNPTTPPSTPPGAGDPASPQPPTPPPQTNGSSVAVPKGRCGRDFGFASCQRFPGEFCCSEFGFCGGTADHCKAETCQFGCDNKDPFLPGKETPKKDVDQGPMQLPEIDENGSIQSCKIPGTISITYDDGPSPLTPNLLNTLDGLKVKTTFFVIGSSIANPGMKEVLIDADRRGHDIASHSFSHSNFLTLSDQQIQEEIKKTEDAIFNAIGKRPRYFRPPFGAVDARVANIVKSMGYKIILWNLDSNDFRHPDDYQAYETAYSSGFSGRTASNSAFISLQHDIHQGTVQFAQKIHEFTIRSGYQPKSVSACLQESAYKN